MLFFIALNLVPNAANAAELYWSNHADGQTQRTNGLFGGYFDVGTTGTPWYGAYPAPHLSSLKLKLYCDTPNCLAATWKAVFERIDSGTSASYESPAVSVPTTAAPIEFIFSGAPTLLSESSSTGTRLFGITCASECANVSYDDWPIALGSFTNPGDPAFTFRDQYTYYGAPWFEMYVADAVPTLSEPGQFWMDAVSAIPEGGTTLETNNVLKATVASPLGNQVKLEVEFRPYNSSFDGNTYYLIDSSFVASGSIAALSSPVLAEDQYHWRARAVDDEGNTSAWQEFGSAGNVDLFSAHRTFRVGVIFFDLADSQHGTGHGEMYYQALTQSVNDYYQDNSFGKYDFDLTFLHSTSDSSSALWSSPSEHDTAYYADKMDFSSQAYAPGVYFGDAAGLIGRNIDDLIDQYDIVIVVHAGVSQRNGRINKIASQFPVYDPMEHSKLPRLIALAELDGVGAWTHELTHAVGTFVTPFQTYTPDLYKLERRKFEHWNLMSYGAQNGNPVIDGNVTNYDDSDPAPFGAYVANFLGLVHEDAQSKSEYGTNYWIGDLADATFGESVFRYNLSESSEDAQEYYLLEARKRGSGNWNNSMPGSDASDLLVTYVDARGYEKYGYTGHGATHDFRNENERRKMSVHFLNPASQSGYKDMKFKVAFRAAEETPANTSPYQIRAEIVPLLPEYFEQPYWGMNLDQGYTLWDKTFAYLASHAAQGLIAPDVGSTGLDLQLYCDDGRHIGMNYQTGVYENDIPDSIVSGEENESVSQWIYVPSTVTGCHYAVSSTRNAEYLAANPDIAAAITDQTDSYSITAENIDPATGFHTSAPLENQIIDPGIGVIQSVITDEDNDPTIETGTVDGTAPSLYISTPTDNSSTYLAKTDLTGYASDGGAGLFSVKAGDVPCTMNEGAWTCHDVPLSVGENVLTITATDAVGNLTNEGVTVTRIATTAAATVSCTSDADGSVDCDFGSTGYDLTPAAFQNRLEVSADGGEFQFIAPGDCNYSTMSCTGSFHDNGRCASNPGATLTYRSSTYDNNNWPTVVAQEDMTVNCDWQPAYVSCQDAGRGDVACSWYASGYEGTAEHGVNALQVSTDDGATFMQVDSNACNDATGRCGTGSASDADRCASNPDTDLVYRSVLVDDTDPDTVLASVETRVFCGPASWYEPTVTMDCDMINVNGGTVECQYHSVDYEGTAGQGQIRLEVSTDGTTFSQIDYGTCDDASGWCSPSSSHYDQTCYSQPFGTTITYRARMVDTTDAGTSLALATKQIVCGAPEIGNEPEYTSNNALWYDVYSLQGTTTDCQLDGGGWSSCSGTVVYYDIPEGSHTFDARSTDSNQTTATSSVTIGVDHTAPQVTITSPTYGSEPSTVRVTVRGTATDAAGISMVTVNGQYCMMHGSNWRCDDVPLWNNDHTLTATAYDAAGNTSAAYLTLAHGPLVIDSGPGAFSNETTADVSFHALVSGTTFTCSLDGATPESCTSPQTFTDLAETPHSLTVVATKGANTDSMTLNWTVTTTEPSVSVSIPTSSLPTYARLIPMVTGTAYSNGPSGDDLASITVNGTACAKTLMYGQYQWECDDVTLDAESDDLTAVATDLAGNTAQSTVTLTSVDTTASASASCTETEGSVDCDFGSTGDSNLSFSPQNRLEVSIGGGAWSTIANGQSCDGHGICTNDAYHDVDRCAQNPGATVTYRSRLVDTAYYPNGLVAQGTDTVSCGWVPAYAFCNETNRGNVGCLWYASGYAGTATHGKNRLLVSYDNGATFSQVATQNCNDSTGLCGNGASVATDDGACSAHPDSDIMYKSVLLDDTDEETVIAEHVSYVNCNLAMYYEPHATIACTYENWGWGNCSYSAWGYEGTAWNGQSILDVSVDGGSYSTLETKYCNDDSGWCESGQKNDYSACYGQPLGTPVTYRVRIVDSSDPETTLASATKDLTCGMPGVTGGPTGTVGYDSASFTFNTYGGDAIACRIDGGSWNSCTSPDEYQDLDPGAHTWDVRATVNSPSGVAISSMSWFIDLDAPTVAFTSPENNAETIASHILVFGTIDGTGTDGMAVSVNGTYCSVHGGSTWRCDVPLTVGTNYLTATGYDGAWNSANAYLTVVRN